MRKKSRNRSLSLAGRLGMAGMLGLQGCAGTPPQKSAEKNELNNFGFPVGFSVEKMDPAADPRKDFTRYTAGRWLDAATIPGDTVRIAGIDIMAKAIERQVMTLVDGASRASETASRGSPLQQVGDHYAAGMDEKHLAELGIEPLKPMLHRISTSTDRSALAETLAQCSLITDDLFVIGVTVMSDYKDRRKTAIYAGDADLGMGTGNYLLPAAQPIRDAYRKLVADDLILAGTPPDEARAIAVKVLEMETRIARKKLSPVDKQDPNKLFTRMRYAELKALLSEVDLDSYFRFLGLPTDGEVIVMEVEALRERNAMLASYPGTDTRAYLRWELVRRTAQFLGPAFVEPGMEFNRAMYGKLDTPPLAKRVAAGVPKLLGHPVSQLYVDKYFPVERKRAVEELVGRIKAEYRGRLVNNQWLTPPTRQYAIEKLDKIEISVGYPEKWIDYSQVDVRRDDYLGNVFRLNTFKVRRELAKLGKPVTHDLFATPGETLAVDANAGYSPDRNGIEIPAAFLQPPFYDAKADPALNYCAIGAVIGHELTHGFDSQGRLYDADGNVRNWWAEADEKNFLAEAAKLVKHASAFEAAPGVFLNGQLAVGENLADVGGVAFGYGALKGYLRDHPEANRKIDGLSQEQRCFLSWAQTWADKAREGWLRQVLAVDPHPTGLYRMTAPSQNEPGFYEAFGIKAGDPLWLDVKDRVKIW